MLPAWLARCRVPLLLGVGFLIVVLAGALLLLAPLPSTWRFGLLLGSLILVIAAAFAAILLLRSWRELNAAQQLLELATGNLGQAHTSLVEASGSLRVTAEARDDALHRLRTAIRERDAFLAAISHDLKTPLTIIKGNAKLLSGQFKGGATPDRTRVAKGLERITASTSFIATVEAISQAGAETEFVDIDEHTYCMSPEALAEYLEGCATDPQTGRPLGRRTGKPIKAIVPVHLYGQVADMDAILDVARQYDLLMVEDACQAQGAEYRSATDGWKRAARSARRARSASIPGRTSARAAKRAP